ncbi:ABC transporter ATP-binding protein [Ligilactobacillus pobuzihii]|uniref:Teichoic acid ABC transporter ATP binding protein n=1 Tax=Ligilactobacillus pobuzihii TaxID=449659 RepID=A0A0R2LGK9_9LACO|nr:ABC transporter ATP-binding protein [Ligilactobacillus pobuzihii]KRK09666.1 teichoic acid ABC transporter ATP binding protein [Ligilactobacillus pobuzihii E100301 = KCTC 13174]KRN99174.1 teichoic acid ABC transporter ATP binding protein [Ligilactobacillus pobuzihii]GEN48426.1 teichoic acids export ATP-binding protein TagH [Ligilactobacillus pobuzihii]
MNSDKIKIKAEYLTKKFELLPAKNTKNKARSLVSSSNKEDQDFWALRNISFEIRNGECVGVIGLNGAGKSTLSNIISGQISQTTGQVEINGDVSIIAANAGMQGNLSGRENIRLKALMVGMSNKEIDNKMDDIIEFSELGPFIDQPVKTYSSGMKAKLGFSIMVHQDPDIMIVDEGLSVGDKTFVDKSRKRMFEFRDQGKTILLVSHDMRTIKEWCDRVIWLNYGEVKAYGTPEEILPEYNKFANWFKKLSRKEQKIYKDKQRQKQMDYSVNQLKKDVLSEDPNMSEAEKQEVTQNLKKNKDSHKLSLLSKVVVWFCLLGFIWTGLVSISDTRLIESIKHPGEFLTERLFKEKKSSEIKSSDVIEIKGSPVAIIDFADKKPQHTELAMKNGDQSNETIQQLVDGADQ